MPIFLDQSLRKALISKIRDSFGRDEALAGHVRVLDQETFIPEAENQVLMTDLQVTNDSLDASNRVTELSGRVTFAPISRPDTSFLFWAQENPRETQLINHGFYELTLHQTDFTESTPTAPDTSWELQVEVINRVTHKRTPSSGIRLFIDDLPTDTLLSDISVTQNMETLVAEADFSLTNPYLYLRRYVDNTRVYYRGTDITYKCSYLELVNQIVTFSRITRSILLPTSAIIHTVSLTNLTLNRPMTKGWNLTPDGIINWALPTFPGTEILIQYYKKNSLLSWELPTEFQVPLEAAPLVFSDGKSSLTVVSSLRGLLGSSMYDIKDSILRILEPIPSETITIDYRYHFRSLGRTVIQPASINDQVIPGIALTFTDNFSNGDKAIVIKHDQVKHIGQENGGTNRVELALKIRSADDKMLERMTSRVFFLFTDQASLFELTNQGISLENAVSYARTYEERDGNSDKWAVNTFRLVIHHTWRYLLPYVDNLNTMSLSTGFINISNDTGAPTFRDLVISSTKDSYIQSY